MKKVFNMFRAIAAMLGASGVSHEEAKAAGIKVSKPRFNAGDRFYQHLTFKRIGGKWKVKR